MKAAMIRETGGPEVFTIEDLPRPEVGPGEVLLRVGASGVNFADVMTRQGIYLSRDAMPQLPAVLGTEAAGVVLQTGRDVDPDLAGQRVTAFVRGGYAEEVVTSADHITPVPDSINLEDAVSVLVQGVTALQLIRDVGRLREGESVLVHAAAGGVGSLAVQLARQYGAGLVIATAGTAEKRELASSLGADIVLDYNDSEWVGGVLEHTGDRGADLVLDSVGGQVGELSVEALGPFGRLVVYGVASGRLAPFAGSQLMQQNQAVIGYWLTSRIAAAPQQISGLVAELLHAVAAGTLRTIIGDILPLEQVAQAHEAVAARATTGKVVLTP